MKKHIDWKRVGWTVMITLGVPCVIVGLTGIGYVIFNNLFGIFPQTPNTIDWVILPLGGSVIIICIFLVIAGLKKLFPKIYHYYYHNGDDNK